MSITFETLKGTSDFLPEKQIVREDIKSALQSIFVKYGFSPVETPILCKRDLLASKYAEGADILNEMYKLSDQGKRELGLRYDLTVTFAKLISSNPDIVLPFKRYEMGKVFRDGPVKSGRMREFCQCDVDMVGIKSIMAEAEYMLMITEFFSGLGIDIEIEFNNRRLLSGIIRYVFGDVSQGVMKSSIMLIDKFAKLSEKELLEQFILLGIDSDKVKKLRKILQSDFETLKKELTASADEVMLEGILEIEQLCTLLKGTPAFENMKFAPYLARGIDVYTGMVWEVFVKGRKAGDVDFNVSICAGGRFDKIISQFIDDGNEYPAVGMSFGLDVICEFLSLTNSKRKLSVVDVFVVPINTDKTSFNFASLLREAGLNADIDKTGQKLKKSLNYANKMEIPFVILIGEDEDNRGVVNIKDMRASSSSEMDMKNIEGIADYIKSNL